ncbi:MAG TPA: ornithine cyclodeaminase family protein [Pseudonocardiaceae bacterium]|nr:ornithine cyclodeaminase family protein [Pseudonocardiaceae bacterium]
MRVLDAAEVTAALPMPVAIDAVRSALRAGLDPAADPARGTVPLDHGQLLVMPAQWGRYAGVKVVSVAPDNPAAGLPRIQGTYLLLDGATLTPVAVLDATALTAIRTAAVSAVAADVLAEPDAGTLVVFGSGPQAHSHVTALRAVRPVGRIVVVGRDRRRAEAFAAWCGGSVGSAADVASADLVACCTTARSPIVDGALLADHATVIAVGSHEPDAAEVDAVTVARSTVVVETASAARREAGDVIRAGPTELVELADLVCGTVTVSRSRPRLFKSVGMAWEDLVLAATTYERAVTFPGAAPSSG